MTSKPWQPPQTPLYYFFVLFILLFSSPFSSTGLSISPGLFPKVDSNAPRWLRALAEPGIRNHIEVRSVAGKGKGAFTTIAVDAGTFLGYYAGEYLSEKQLFARYPCLMREGVTRGESLAAGCSYIFGLDFDGEMYVDAANPWFSNWVRYVNHSNRRKNCISYIDDVCKERPMIYLQALRNIDAGEELLFDYGKDFWEGYEGKIVD